VRAQLLAPAGQLVDDFLIVERPRALHVCNAPSPAATASLAIACSKIGLRLPRALLWAGLPPTRGVQRGGGSLQQSASEQKDGGNGLFAGGTSQKPTATASATSGATRTLPRSPSFGRGSSPL
jgi:hypothetical protein